MFIKRFKTKNRNLYNLFKYYKKNKRLITYLIVVMVLASSLGMLLPYFYSKRLIGITKVSYNSVLRYSVLIILIILFHHIFWYFWEYLASILSNKVQEDIRSDITNKLFTIEYLKIENKSTGFFLERINDDTYEVSNFLSNVLGTIVDSLTNFSFLILIYFLNYKCGIIFSVGIIILYVIDLFKIKLDLKYTEILKELEELYNSKIVEIIKGIKEINGLGIKNEILKTTNTISDEIKKTITKKDKICALLSRIKTFTQYLLECILIIYSVKVLIPNKSLTVVMLLMILDYSGFMYDLTNIIAKMKDYFVKGEYKAKRILEILNEENIYNYNGNNCDFHEFNIAVKNLTYSYDDKIIFDNASFNIKENTLNLFIGQSGSGKSTLFGILSRLLKIDKKCIFIGNKDINEIRDKEYKEKICIVNQEPFLINDTILNNIKIVYPTANKKKLIEVCKKANIYDEIMSMPDKFNTEIVENGNNLSGGQKQRISIARALLKDSKILLFDEPTSALDYYNHKLFFDTVKELKKEKTILIIGHKIKELDIFDNVFELKNKKIIRKKR